MENEAKIVTRHFGSDIDGPSRVYSCGCHKK